MQQAIGEIRIESCTARDGGQTELRLIARLEFSENQMAITVGAVDGDGGGRINSPIWEHTIYELENLATALRYVANAELPDSFHTSSREMFFGPTVNLWPAVEIEVGHPGAGPQEAALFYCSAKNSKFRNRRFVYIGAYCAHRGEHGIFGVDEALNLADKISELAISLAPDLLEGWTP